ncbi:unannotated protein [freshwater metagenome]|uniref:Unannotated protein n=1 Tax=freshwater metagenome TaxID=449393 RepID=A0A6J7JFC6_9ZZZZ
MSPSRKSVWSAMATISAMARARHAASANAAAMVSWPAPRISAKAGTRLHWYGFSRLICVVMKRVLVWGQRSPPTASPRSSMAIAEPGPPNRPGSTLPHVMRTPRSREISATSSISMSGP